MVDYNKIIKYIGTSLSILVKAKMTRLMIGYDLEGKAIYYYGYIQ